MTDQKQESPKNRHDAKHQVDGLVICSAVNDDCQAKCIHRVPHNEHWDTYGDDGEMMACTEGQTLCGYRDEEPRCACK